jgi:hypothetical protein
MKRLIAALLSVAVVFLVIYQVTPVYASEPTLPEIFDDLGFTNVSEVEVVAFPAGYYEITLYAEFAGFNEENNLSSYTIGGDTFDLIFDGPEGGFGYINPPITKTIMAEGAFGLSMCTPENHRYFTEHYRNPDGEQHSIVYENLDDPVMYLIGFENLYGAGDRDYQDFVLSLRLKTPSNFVPEVPFGTILSSTAMLTAFAGFIWFKRFRGSHA